MIWKLIEGPYGREGASRRSTAPLDCLAESIINVRNAPTPSHGARSYTNNLLFVRPTLGLQMSRSRSYLYTVDPKVGIV